MARSRNRYARTSTTTSYRRHQEHPRLGSRRRPVLAGTELEAGEERAANIAALVILASEDIGWRIRWLTDRDAAARCCRVRRPARGAN